MQKLKDKHALNQNLNEMLLANDTLSPLTQAKALLRSGQYQQAVAILQPALKQTSEYFEYYYVLAASYRYLAQLEDALSTINICIALHVEYARAYQEQGHIYLALNQPKQALAAYQNAVKLNPALPASWQKIITLSEQFGSTAQQQQAIAQWHYYAKLAKPLVAISSMLHEGKIAKAEQHCRQFLQKSPLNIDAMRLLAQIAVKHNVLDDADVLLVNALKIQPDNHWLQYDLVHVLHKRQQFERAYKRARSLLNEQTDNPSYQLLFANQCMAVGLYEKAIEYYLLVVQQLPENADVYLVLGHAYKTHGDSGKAISAYQNAYKFEHYCADAYWSLANLKRYQFSHEEVEFMQSTLLSIENNSLNLPLAKRYQFSFALAKAYEDRENYQASFYYYQLGNQLKANEEQFDIGKLERDFLRQRQFFTNAFLQPKRSVGCLRDEVIFIVGMPRAGSTLLEQVLASHSQIEGTAELHDILAMVHQLNGRLHKQQSAHYPNILADKENSQLCELGEQYLAQTQVHRKDSNARYFIDKMPNNFAHIGLIKLILPNAKIIDIRREPIACCFSNFKQLYAQGQAFSYQLDDMARYYRAYTRLMDHWQQVFPEQIYHLSYEALIHDFESEVRNLLTYLNLPFEPSCLNYHQNTRAVKTASAEQVRQPLNKHGLNQWQHYHAYLSPLISYFEQA